MEKYFPQAFVVLPPNSAEAADSAHRTCDECSDELEMIRDALEPVQTRLELESANNSRNGSMRKKRKKRKSSKPVEINENDFCPICNMSIRRLKEIEKEEHINECLERAQFSGSPEVARSPNKMLVYRLPSDFIGFHRKHENENSNFASQSDEEIDGVELGIEDGIGDAEVQTEAVEEQFGKKFKERFSYESEDEDNECCICLEEFSANDKVARLECLCMFHYKCISDWFNKKGQRECPVHAIHH